MHCSSLIIIIFFIVSCGQPEATRSLNIPYVGDWRTDCSSENESFVDRVFSFYSNNRFEYSQKSYQSSSCESESDNHLYATGYYYVDTQKKTSSATHKIMFRLDSIDITPGSESGSLKLSGLAYCGISDWAVNESFSVLGARCEMQIESRTILYVSDNEDHTKFVRLSDASFFMGEGFLEKTPRALTGSRPFKFQRQP